MAAQIRQSGENQRITAKIALLQDKLELAKRHFEAVVLESSEFIREKLQPPTKPITDQWSIRMESDVVPNSVSATIPQRSESVIPAVLLAPFDMSLQHRLANYDVTAFLDAKYDAIARQIQRQYGDMRTARPWHERLWGAAPEATISTNSPSLSKTSVQTDVWEAVTKRIEKVNEESSIEIKAFLDPIFQDDPFQRDGIELERMKKDPESSVAALRGSAHFARYFDLADELQAAGDAVLEAMESLRLADMERESRLGDPVRDDLGGDTA